VKAAPWPRILLGSLVLFAVLNLAIGAALSARWHLPPRFRPLGPVASRIGLERLARAYPEMSKGELALFLSERAAVNRWEYESFTDFRQRPVRGRFINVSAVGFRAVKGQGPWPPAPDAFNVFVFGGSTAFGDGLPDGETLPSALQELLPTISGRPARVYNFARPGYYSSQERILLEQLLVSRVVPDAALFIDGLNESFHPAESPEHPRWSSGVTDRLSAATDEANGRANLYALGSLARSLPITRVALKLLERASPGRFEPPSLTGVAARWLANVCVEEAVAARFSVPVLFVWQPIPTYRYDLRYHLLGAGPDFLHVEPANRVYEDLRRMRESRPEEFRRILWLADAQEGRRENLYVDEVHYTARFARELAGTIAKRLSSDLASEERQAGLEGGGIAR